MMKYTRARALFLCATALPFIIPLHADEADTVDHRDLFDIVHCAETDNCDARCERRASRGP